MIEPDVLILQHSNADFSFDLCPGIEVCCPSVNTRSLATFDNFKAPTFTFLLRKAKPFEDVAVSIAL